MFSSGSYDYVNNQDVELKEVKEDEDMDVSHIKLNRYAFNVYIELKLLLISSSNQRHKFTIF